MTDTFDLESSLALIPLAEEDLPEEDLEEDDVAGSVRGNGGLAERARALALDSWWGSCPGAKLILRPGPGGGVGVVGHFDQAMLARLQMLRQQLAEPLPRCLTYRHVEELVDVLAARLIDHFGSRIATEAAFTAIPRGGFIVLGLLAYCLGIGQGRHRATGPGVGNRHRATGSGVGNRHRATGPGVGNRRVESLNRVGQSRVGQIDDAQGVEGFGQGGLRARPFASGPPADGRPWIIVDDIALTGSRFRQWLHHDSVTLSERGGDHSPVIFAHLLSHPDLRSAIETREARVQLCLAGRDLIDHAPEQLGDGYHDWIRQRLGAPGPGCYWVGQTEPVVFPWSEPERGFWNSANGNFERVWHIVPGDYCLRNRPSPARTGIEIHSLPSVSGVLALAPGVLAAELDNRVLLTQGDGRSFVLNDTAADFWLALRMHGSMSEVIGALSRLYGVESERVGNDLNQFVESLVARGLVFTIEGKC